MSDILTIQNGMSPESLAKEIADLWFKWDKERGTWLDEKRELREYLFATSTKNTTNKKLPWKNSTVTPKLTQIRDNLHANYMAALFPREDWFIWQGGDNTAVSKKKRAIVESYMWNKLKQAKFPIIISQLVLDYIDYGNVFASHEYVNETKEEPVTGEKTTIFQGSRPFRISPLDIVFDITATSFEKSPCIVRTLKSYADFKLEIDAKPQLGYDKSVLEKCHNIRRHLTDYTEQLKSEGITVDGFGSLEQYFTSGQIEVLEFFGDMYDWETDKVLKDHIITVVDRRWILRKVGNPSWRGQKPIFHCGWRLRPDNLWAQGPLDQLVGMQYRIDHLENLKADVFDQVAHPMIKVKGNTVEDFTFGPGEKMFCGDEGDIEFLRPEAAALNADMQIQELMNRMEELAGAPKQAMGIRTPGEKTKYEVQSLDNAAGRIFEAKTNWFEANLIERLINSMFEESRRNFKGKEAIPIIDSEYGVVNFEEITKDDVLAEGSLYPIGARHFAAQARFVQELAQTLQVVMQIPSVSNHISGKAIAKALEENLGWRKYELVKDNISVLEQAETQKIVNVAQEQLQNEAAIPADLQPQDIGVEE